MSLTLEEVGLTIWSGQGATWGYERAAPLITWARPQYLQLHTDPVSMAGPKGRVLVDRIRHEQPGVRLVPAVPGDAYGPDPSHVWADWARAAVRYGCREVMLDPEAVWKTVKRGATLADRVALARKCVRAIRAAAPGLVIWFTSYDGPVVVKARHLDGTTYYWGGHETYPWEGFEGEPTPCDEEHRQCYSAPVDGSMATPGMLANRCERGRASHEAAVRKGLISPRVRQELYVQAHHVHALDTVTVAQGFHRVSLWAGPALIDQDGAVALAVLAELVRRRMTFEESLAAMQLPPGTPPARLLLAWGMAPAPVGGAVKPEAA